MQETTTRGARRYAVWTGTVLAAGALGLASLGLFFGPGPADARGFFRGGHHGPGGHVELMRFGIRRMLDEVDATAEQREQIDAILDELQLDMMDTGPGRREFREALVTELSAPTIEREAIEALRAEMVASFDARSRRIADAMVRVGEVLTPEQRAVLPELMDRHRGHRRSGGREGDDERRGG